MAEMTRRGQLVRDDSNFPTGYNYFFQAFSTSASIGNVALKPGILHTVTLDNPTAAATITIYDGSATSTATIANITVAASPQPQTFIFDVGFTTALTLVTSGTPGNITVSYISADK